MDFYDYQASAKMTAIYPNEGSNICYPALGLAGESGEVCEKVKKVIRDDTGIISTERRNDLKKELGDVLWYVSAMCSELGLSMADVAESNLAKLKKRQEKGTLKGSGDNR